MDNILLLDTSVASLNKGDDIIMECVKTELQSIIKDNFLLTLPTHVCAFHWYQVLRNSCRIQKYKNCKLKFIGGTNLLAKNMLTHYPQWNINIFNYRPMKGSVLVGVGAGAGEYSNLYTKYLYGKILNHDIYHSVRDERSKSYLESLGLKAINTGCVTMWVLTPEFCKEIPVTKARNVVFTLTSRPEPDRRDQMLIDILHRHYDNLFFWVQGDSDYTYLHKFENISDIRIVNPSIREYAEILKRDDIEYIGTRLHAGVYAMRHKKRSIIIAIDERTREINKSNNLNCIEKDNIDQLPAMIESTLVTEIEMPLDKIRQWKRQFE